MKEAFRLLNKSIIRVETPDIDFEEGEEELVNGEGGGGGWEGGGVGDVETGMVERGVEGGRVEMKLLLKSSFC